MAPGWVQQQSQLPEHFRTALRAEAADNGHGSIRTLGTIAYGVLLGMPKETRTAMHVWMQSRLARHGPDIEPAEVFSMLMRLTASEPVGSTTSERLGHLLALALTLRNEVDLIPTESPGRKKDQD